MFLFHSADACSFSECRRFWMLQAAYVVVGVVKKIDFKVIGIFIESDLIYFCNFFHSVFFCDCLRFFLTPCVLQGVRKNINRLLHYKNNTAMTLQSALMVNHKGYVSASNDPDHQQQCYSLSRNIDHV